MIFQHSSSQILKNVMRTGDLLPHERKNDEKTQGFPMIFQHTSSQTLKNVMRTDVFWA